MTLSRPLSPLDARAEVAAHQSDSVPVALALGANLGRPEQSFRRAISELSRNLDEIRIASLYRSEAISPLPQPDFLNTALIGATRLPAVDLLALAKYLERAAGRQKGPPKGPRPLDVDLLIYGDRVIAEPDLTVPHPRMTQRSFVLAPLAEIAPHWLVPPSGKTVARLLEELDPSEGPACERLSWTGTAPVLGE